jgi:hypothetical protein
MADFKAKMDEIKAKMVDIKSRQFDSQVKTKKFGPSEQSTPEGMEQDTSEYSENNTDFFAFNLADLDKSISPSNERSYTSLNISFVSDVIPLPVKSKEIKTAKANENVNTNR